MSSFRLLSSVAVAYASIGMAQEFQHGCGTSGRLPPPLKSVLQAIDQTDPLNIDEACGIKGGAGSDNPGKQAESSAKNNFCATASAVTITTQTLRALQREVDKDESLKTKAKAGDRSGLAKLVKVGSQTIGEGSPVTLVAYLQDAHFS